MMDDIDRTFTWWNNARNGVRGSIDADTPMAGYYRWVWKKKTGTEMGVVAIWYDTITGELRYQVDGKDIEDTKARTRWPHDSRRPISEEIFWNFRESGVWLDVDPAIQAHAAEVLDVEVASPEEILRSDIVSVKDAASKYSKVESDEEMTLAQSVRAKLQELGAKADKLRVAEKEPHLQASRDVDARWQPMIKEAKAAADGVRKAMEGWNDFKLQMARKAKIEADKLSLASLFAGGSPSVPVASNAPSPSTQVSGGGGRAAHVGIKDVITDIDIDLAFKQFRNEPDLRQCLLMLAGRAHAAGIEVPGIVIEQKSAIR